jgi:hypothetical protein
MSAIDRICMIRLLANPLSPLSCQASCLSFSFFQCVAGQAYWHQERGLRGEGAKIIRRWESLTIYKAFNTLWGKSVKYVVVQLFFTSFFISTERDIYKQTEQTGIRNGCGIPFDVFLKFRFNRPVDVVRHDLPPVFSNQRISVYTKDCLAPFHENSANTHLYDQMSELLKQF